jgi:hypothetical protein
MKSIFLPFVYGLVDPLEPGHIRYVGMASVRADRPLEHAKEARKLSTSPSYKINWIRKVQSEGREPAVVVLEELSEGSSQDLVGFCEKAYIKSLREIGHRLTNVAEGGNGGNTGPLTPEVEAKRQASLKLAWASPELRARHSETLLNAQTPELREKHSRNNKATWAKRKTEGTDKASEATCKLLSDAWTPERRKAQGLRMTGREIPEAWIEKSKVEQAKALIATRAAEALLDPEQKEQLRVRRIAIRVAAGAVRRANTAKRLAALTPEERVQREIDLAKTHAEQRERYNATKRRVTAANALLSPELRIQKEIMRLQKLAAKLKAEEERINGKKDFA